eukprot:gene2178-4235_t
MNETKTPKRPAGPPPARPPAARPPPPMESGLPPRGMGEIKKPPGPPPGAGVPVARLKPPPMAPPPMDMGASGPRPMIQNVRDIDLHKGLLAQNAADKAQPTFPLDGGVPGRGPPRPIPVAIDYIPEAGYGLIGAGKAPKFSPMAAPKYPSVATSSPMRKPGAIPMFNPSGAGAGTVESPAESKDGWAMAPSPLVRVPRPAAPTLPTPGIPIGQPLPPSEKPIVTKVPPAPTRPAPSRGRLPPTEEPPDNSKLKKMKPSAPVGEEPPFKRNYQEPVSETETRELTRREKEHPEFEESSGSDNDDEKESGSQPPDAMSTGQMSRPVSTAGGGGGGGGGGGSQFGSRPGSVAPSVSSPSPVSQTMQSELGGVSPLLSRDRSALESSPPSPSLLDPRTPPSRSVAPSTASTDRRPMDQAGSAPPPIPSLNVPGAMGVNGDRKRSVARSLAFTNPEVMAAAANTNRGGKSTVRSDNRSDMGGTLVPRPFSRGLPQETSTPPTAINGGRFTIRCIEGIDVTRPNVNSSRLDPFLKFKLGAAERLPWLSTKVQRKQDSNPIFQNEMVIFDILQPSAYLYDNNILLYIEIWNSSTTKDEAFAAVTMSVLRIFQHPYTAYKETVPLQISTGKPYAGKLVLEFSFEEARPGMLVCTLFEGRGLRSLDTLGHQDPYVQLALGENYNKRSKVAKGGGRDPYFEEEDVVMWVDKEIWINDVTVSVCDEQIGAVQPIGTTKFSPLSYMNIPPGQAQQEVFELMYPEKIQKGGEAVMAKKGELSMKVVFLPAGKLTIRCVKAKDLAPPPNKDNGGGNGAEVRMDPYLTLTMEGQAAKIVKRSTTDKDGGSDPVWDCDVEFDVVDQYLVDVEVYDQDLGGSDVLLGTTQLSLLAVFKAGKINVWSTLRLRREGLGVKETGDVNFAITFTAPPNIAYPQYRKDIDSFDDTLRAVDMEQFMDDPNAMNTGDKPLPVGVAEEVMNKIVPAYQSPPEFTEDEIVAAFRFIDLDHNNFVGAAEIRHILVCMGELITDEEIDMMISMVDMDGDGQVSLNEFRTLVLHPNPGDVDLHQTVLEDRAKSENKEKQALKGKQKDMDATAYQRQKEMAQREAKKKMLLSFIDDNDTIFENLTKAFSVYETLPKEQRVNGRINFPTFCQLLKVEPIGEYVRLFGLFDPEDQGLIDLREFFLSTMNFLKVDREARIRFSFLMYDDIKSGYISQKEVEEILKGNHMIGLSSVQRKAQTVMKQAAANANGAITLQELIVVSKKFPNIMLPTFNQAGTGD